MSKAGSKTKPKTTKRGRGAKKDAAPSPWADYEPTPREAETLLAYFDARDEMPPALIVETNGDGAPSVTLDHPDPVTAHIMLAKAWGSDSVKFAYGLVGQLANLPLSPASNAEKTMQFAASIVTGIKPTDQIEAMLAAQMAATHILTMKYATASDKATGLEQQEACLNAVNKLGRTFAAQVEALGKHRGKGSQKVTVEHVHVYPGGTANVGVVGKDQPASPPPGEGGGTIAINGQIHGNQALPLPTGAPMLRHVPADKVAMPSAGRKGKPKVPVSRGALGRTLGTA